MGWGGGWCARRDVVEFEGGWVSESSLLMILPLGYGTTHGKEQLHSSQLLHTKHLFYQYSPFSINSLSPNFGYSFNT